MTDKEFHHLLDKYLAGKASESEEQLLRQIYHRLEDKYNGNLPDNDTLSHLEDKLIEEFRITIRSQETETNNIRPLINRTLIVRIAAAILILLGFTFYLSYRSRQVGTFLAGVDVKQPVRYCNKTETTQKILFPDKSFVLLKPGSIIEYERNFSGSLRQVNLRGEGFFQVTANPKKPFIVYTETVVAKVLGTSFLIKSGVDDSEASVTVTTGKVSVFKTAEIKKGNTLVGMTNGMIILPNHTASLSPEQKLEKTLPKSLHMLHPVVSNSFDFDNTPVETAFSRLQEHYGIAIRYDKEKVRSCSISVSLGKEDFYQKLDIICRTINASYVIDDGNIVVTAKGCTN